MAVIRTVKIKASAYTNTPVSGYGLQWAVVGNNGRVSALFFSYISAQLFVEHHMPEGTQILEVYEGEE